MAAVVIFAPVALTAEHKLGGFDCGVATLDLWLPKRALANQDSGASRTYVALDGEGAVVGYYALATGSVAASVAPGRVKRNMPDPIPVMVLGRLAVDRRYRGQGIGMGLLRDAVLRTLQASGIAGIRALLVHAIDDGAARFYEQAGFSRFPMEDKTLFLVLADAQRLMDGGHERPKSRGSKSDKP